MERSPWRRSCTTSSITHSADRITAKGIAGVDPNAHHIARVDPGRIKLLQSLVANLGVSEGVRRRGGEDIEPAGREDRCPERLVTRVNQMNGQGRSAFPR